MRQKSYITSLPKSSLIIATYNWPTALELCLKSCLLQSYLPDEIIIADDGSKEETKALIEGFSYQSLIPIIHIWHEDIGFRLGVIRNKAIAAARFEYIIQIDGDLILHRDFIYDHLTLAKKNQLVSGSRALIKQEYSQRLITNKDSCKLSSIPIQHLDRKYYALRWKLLQRLNSWLKSTTNAYKYVLGANMAFWKNDLLEVNGYNEDIVGWGKEDNEIAVRLINANKKLLLVKNLCLVYHLNHTEASRQMLDINKTLLEKAINEKLTYIHNGIKK